MPKSSTSFESFVSPEELQAVVVAVDKYPEFLPEVKQVVVRSRHDDGFLASFTVEVKVAGLEVKTEYTVRYKVGPGEVTWTLEESPTMSKNEGRWRFEEIKDGETKAFYEAEIETSLPIAPELQKMFAEQELPRMMQRFRDRAEA
jgi:ribosome-associated toxin RatA of RatAB toxin-antitoxin module